MLTLHRNFRVPAQRESMLDGPEHLDEVGRLLLHQQVFRPATRLGGKCMIDFCQGLDQRTYADGWASYLRTTAAGALSHVYSVSAHTF